MVHKTLVRTLSLSLMIVILTAITFVGLNAYGKGRRVFGTAGLLNDPMVEKTIVGTPETAIRVWKERNFRGRILFYIGDRWERVNVDEFIKVPHARSYPLALYNPARMVEKNYLDSSSFLYVAAQAGIARSTVAVLSERGFEEMRMAATGAKNVSISEGRLRMTHMGFSRLFTTIDHLWRIQEPVLLYVDASYFTDNEPQKVFLGLRQAGIRADSIVLCDREDDPMVNAEGRSRLKQFGELSGAHFQP